MKKKVSEIRLVYMLYEDATRFTFNAIEKTQQFRQLGKRSPPLPGYAHDFTETRINTVVRSEFSLAPWYALSRHSVSKVPSLCRKKQ